METRPTLMLTSYRLAPQPTPNPFRRPAQYGTSFVGVYFQETIGHTTTVPVPRPCSPQNLFRSTL